MMSKRFSMILVGVCLTWMLHAQDKPENFELDISQTDLSIQFVGIPAGTLNLGSKKSKEDDEEPRKEVEISAFWMSSHEITHDLFMVYRDPQVDLDEDGNPRVDGITRPSAPYEDPVFGMGKFGFPAAGMTQFGALQFCRWLSEKTGEFYRLPTEAEWEYACKAGEQDAPYFFGKKKKQLSQYAWYEKNSEDRFHEVGKLKPNPWGLYDILGNVAEWTLDQYQEDAYNQWQNGVADPWIKPTALHPRSVRGGSFRDEPEDLRSANRIESTLDWKKRDPQIPKSFWWNTDSPFVGFRIIKPVEQPTQEEQNAFWALVLGG